MSIFPVGDSSVAAALAAMPLAIRATRAADYVFLMRRAERMDKIAPDVAARMRLQAAALLVLPTDRACDHCGELVTDPERIAYEFTDADLGITWLSCKGCEADVVARILDEHDKVAASTTKPI